MRTPAHTQRVSTAYCADCDAVTEIALRCGGVAAVAPSRLGSAGYRQHLASYASARCITCGGRSIDTSRITTLTQTEEAQS